jgi:predicted Ser/Thr protein kinase
MNPSPSYKRTDLTVIVDTPQQEIDYAFKSILKKDKYEENPYEYYKIYMKHLLGPNSRAPIEKILNRLEDFRQTIEYRMLNVELFEERFVRTILTQNNYVSKSTSRSGVTVKLFRAKYNGRDSMIKTYVYDGECPSLEDRIMSCFKDEVLFQYYANKLKTEFISPEIYSWGQFRKYQFIGDNYFYKCLYLIMEYIPGLTIKSATYNTATMKTMYERVQNANASMMAAGIHHNDLHGGNVMVVDKSPLPEVVIIDFGEASLGPKKPLFK